jgi:hypothetical protein
MTTAEVMPTGGTDSRGEDVPLATTVGAPVSCATVTLARALVAVGVTVRLGDPKGLVRV